MLSNSQKRALIHILKEHNILICGSAGTGKSYLVNIAIKYIHKKYPNKTIQVTGSTGIAAINIGGMTLHSYAGIGVAEGSEQIVLKKVIFNNAAMKRIKSTDILIIDEISMVSSELFNKLDYVFRVIRKNEKAFGGVQLILLGDFYQLPPVIKKDTPKIFAFESDAWSKAKLQIVNLTQNFRQSDEEYKNILNRLRVGDFDEQDIQKIKSRIIHDDIPGNIIKLFPTNKQVAISNDTELKKLDGLPKLYYATYSGNKELKNELKQQFKSNTREIIKLKLDARVMLTINLDIDNGLCNGSLGIVVDFAENLPIVLFDNGQVRTVDYHKWELERNLSFGYVVQMPLILAWSTSIHKSQGLTFDRAQISLDKCFAEHQIYVALSRIKTLDGLYITGDFSPYKIKINPKVKTWYKNIL